MEINGLGQMNGARLKFDGTTWTIYNTSNSVDTLNSSPIIMDVSGNKMDWEPSMDW